MSISFESRNDWDFAKFKHLFGAFGRFYNPPSTYPDVNPLRCEQKYHEGRRTSSKFKNLLCGLFPRFHRNEINSSKYYSPDQVVIHSGIHFRENMRLAAVWISVFCFVLRTSFSTAGDLDKVNCGTIITRTFIMNVLTLNNIF